MWQIIGLISSFSNFLTSLRLVRFFRLIAPRWPSTAAGAISLKNLTKCEEVRKGADQANYHQWENLHKIYERIIFSIFTLYYYEFKIPQNLSLIIQPKYFLNPDECHSLFVEIRASIWVFSGPKDSIWGANESKHHACLREQTESTWIRTIY